MACGKAIGSLNAFRRISVVDASNEPFFVTTDWMPLTGLTVRAWLNLLAEAGDGVLARVAYQTAQQFAQADISAMFQIKPCGKVVGDVNVAGVEVDATRDIPVSEWFESVDVSNVRIGYILEAASTGRIDWFIQTANDTNRPADPSGVTGASQVSGQGSGTFVTGNTGDLDLSGDLTPSATQTPAWARIMARVSVSAGGAVAIDQLVANVQVS